MKYDMYCYYDRLTGLYSEPWLSQNEAVAIRRFNYEMSKALMVANDYELYFLGVFDTESGKIEGDTPKFVRKYIPEVTE